MKSLMKGFTLVELIVVITILSILSILGFISFINYTISARDSVRLSDIKMITKSFNNLLVTNEKLPLPDNSIHISLNGKTVFSQGLFSHNSITNNQVFLNSEADYYYTLMDNHTEYQVATILEKPYSQDSKNFTHNVHANNQNLYFVGKNIGLVFKNSEIYTSTGGQKPLDILSLDTGYSFLSKTENIVNTQSEIVLKVLESKEFSSCQNIIDVYGSGMISGNYNIVFPDNSGEKVFCEMQIEGGGWMRYAEIISEFNFENALSCLENKEVIDEEGFYCFNPHQRKIDANTLMIQQSQDYANGNAGDIYTSDISSDFVGVGPLGITGTSNYMCATGNKYMTKMVRVTNGYLSHLRLGLPYCTKGRQVGGIAVHGNIMNFGSHGAGPTGGNGVDRNRNKDIVPYTFYIK